MSRLKLAKKLQPAKKAWKCFSNKLQSKIHKVNLSKAIKTTLQNLLSAFKSLIHLINSRRHRTLAATRTYSTYHHYHVQSKNISAIHIDDLFAEKGTHHHHHHSQGETSREVNHGESSGLNSIEDAWKAVVARSPHLQVDQRAEEFISKFHEDMRLQKERSMIEFQEMLARSA